jgi:hypothetical protein
MNTTTMKIVDCSISKMPEGIFDPLPEVSVTLEDGTHTKLFSYYPDEISFQTKEFIGLTITEGMLLKMSKDKAYLQS